MEGKGLKVDNPKTPKRLQGAALPKTSVGKSPNLNEKKKKNLDTCTVGLKFDDSPFAQCLVCIGQSSDLLCATTMVFPKGKVRKLRR